MTSIQYEELCRWFIAGQLKIVVEQVRSVRIPNPQRDHQETLVKLVPFQHQIDLYWETANAELRYINIANAKWRSHDAVHQHDVLLLKVGAHKAILITNSSFTAHAEQAAWDEGIGLLLLQPAFATHTLHATDRGLIQNDLHDLAEAGAPLCSCTIVQKGMPGSVSAADILGPVSLLAGHPAALTAYNTRCLASPSPPGQASSPGSLSSHSPGQGASSRRHGPGLGFRTK